MDILIKNSEIEFPSNYTVIDIETTGLSCSKCEIIELSALKIRDCKIVDRFSSLVKPQGMIDPFITSLTGISNETVKDSASVEYVLPKFIQFISSDILLGHNVNFDLRFIRYNLRKHFGIDIDNKSVDTLRLSKKYCKNLHSYKLEVLANLYNVNTDGHHRALNDCIMTHEVYLSLKHIYANQQNLNLIQF